MLNPFDILQSKYQIICLLGAGGMSNIYKCRILGAPTDQFWVIKEMSVSYQDPNEQATAVELFLREGQLLQKLDHKNLPKVIDRFVVGGKYHFVMEYVEGEDLGKLITRNPGGLPENRVLGWAIEVAQVLYYLHCQQPPIVFRDMKPSNIMIARGTVKLIDFGIARSFKPNKKKDTISIGSPGYAPPEQYSGQTDPRSDIYALGATLHHLLTGRDPTETRTPFKFEPVHALKPTISPAVSDIIAKAVDLDPNNRFQTALEMKKALQAVTGTGTRPVGARPGAPSEILVSAPKTQLAMERPLNLAQAALDAQSPPHASAATPAAHGPTGTTAIGTSAPPASTPSSASTSAAVPSASTPDPNASTPASPDTNGPAKPGMTPPPPPAQVPKTPKPPRQPVSLLVKVGVCAMAALFGRGFKMQIRAELQRLFPGPFFGSPPPPAPKLDPGPLGPALDLLAQNQVREAQAWVRHYLSDNPQDVTAALLLETCRARLLALAPPNGAGQAILKVPFAVPKGNEGTESLRGALLAEEEINWNGGANATLVDVEPQATDASPLSIGDFSTPSATGGGISLSALSTGTPDGPVSVAPSLAVQWQGLLGAVKASRPKAATLLIVTDPKADVADLVKSADGFKVDVASSDKLPAELEAYGGVVVDVGPDQIADVARKVQAKKGHVPVWCLRQEGTTAIDGLMTVTNWWGESTDASAMAFALHYERRFNQQVPTIWSRRGYDAVMAVKSALLAASGPSVAEVATALHKGPAVSPTVWYWLKFQKDAWHLAGRVELGTGTH